MVMVAIQLSKSFELSGTGENERFIKISNPNFLQHFLLKIKLFICMNLRCKR